MPKRALKIRASAPEVAQQLSLRIFLKHAPNRRSAFATGGFINSHLNHAICREACQHTPVPEQGNSRVIIGLRCAATRILAFSFGDEFDEKEQPDPFCCDIVSLCGHLVIKMICAPPLTHTLSLVSHKLFPLRALQTGYTKYDVMLFVFYDV